MTKKEKAYAHAMYASGHNPTKIASSLGRNNKTVSSTLQKKIDDPDLLEMISLIKKSELSELHEVGYKARRILNEYLDAVLRGDKEPNVISVTAVLDRTFQQRRLLEGEATVIFDAKASAAEIRASKARIAELEAELQYAEAVELKQDESGVYHAGED